jgi:hypothetical protein
MRTRLGTALLGLVLAAALPPALAGAETVDPHAVKPQVVQPQIVTPASAPAPVQAPAPAPRPAPAAPVPPDPAPVPDPSSQPAQRPSSPTGDLPTGGPGHPSRVPRPPHYIPPPLPDLPLPSKIDECDDACVQAWYDYLARLFPGGSSVGTTIPFGPNCLRMCLDQYVTELKIHAKYPDAEKRYDERVAAPLPDPLADALEILHAFGFNGFDGRIPDGTVEVIEDPIFFPDQGQTSPPGWDGDGPLGPGGGLGFKLFDGTIFELQ